MHPQIACFAVSAVAHGALFARWRKLTLEEKQRETEWTMRGWFHGVSCFGSVTGAIVFSFRMVQLSQIYKVVNLRQNPAVAVCTSDAARNDELCLTMFDLNRDIFRLAAALSIVTPLELAFVIIAKLLVLHRLQRLAISRSPRRHIWEVAARVFLAFVIVVNVVGFASSVAAAAVFYSQTNVFGGQAVTAWEANKLVLF